MENNSNKILKILTYIFIAIQFIMSVVFATMVLNLNMLPTKYFVAMSIGMLILLGIPTALAMLKDWKRIFSIIVSIIFTIVLIFGSFLTNKTDKTIDELNNGQTYYDEIVIVVNANSNIQKTEDLDGKKIGVQLNTNADLTLAAEGMILDQFNIRFTTKEYNTIVEQINGLRRGEVDAIIYNKQYSELILEENPDVLKDTKIIETLQLDFEDIVKYKNQSVSNAPPETKPPTEPTEEETIPTEPPPQKKDVFAVYLSGVDVTGKINTKGRSDVNIIAIVDPNDKEILLITTPRDCYVKIPNISGDKRDKLTHAGIYGVNASINTLSELYNVNIDYYFRVNFTSFEKIIDALGGVSVYSAYNFSARGYSYQKGYNELNGSQALIFARERYSFPDGDHQRGRNQQEVIKAAIKKACSPAILLSANEILDSVRGNIDMNIPETLIQDMIKQQLDEGGDWNITTMEATGTGKEAETYSAPGMKLYVMEPNMESIEKIREEIRKMYD